MYVIFKRNDRFPLSVPGKIAAYGNGGRHTIKGGTGSGEVNSRYFVSVEEGLRAAGFTITTNNWLDAYDRKLAQALVLDFIKKLCVCHFFPPFFDQQSSIYIEMLSQVSTSGHYSKRKKTHNFFHN